MPWWRSLRTRVAAAVALISMLSLLALGIFVDQRAATSGRERLRLQAFERLESTRVLYLTYDRLRADASLHRTGVPTPILDEASTTRRASYYDGRTMWAGQIVDGDRLLTIRLSGADMARERAALRRAMVTGGAVTTLVAFALSWLVATGLSRRLRAGASAARLVARGEHGVTAHRGGRDEVALLTRSVDEMAAALQRRLEAEQGFTADVAHELRTPVTALVSASELLPDDEVSSLVRNQVDRLRRLVEDLLEISRLESGRERVLLEEVDLEGVVRRVVEGLGPDLPVELVVRGSEAVLAEPRRVERVVTNLVANAHRHGGGSCRVVVDGALVRVEDDGPGYPVSVVEHGPRRFAGEGATKGTGLGLTIVERQAEAMGATVTLANRSGRTSGAQAVLALRPARGEGGGSP